MSKLIQVPVVYLAGGMRTDWQDKVIAAACGHLHFIDPRGHRLKDENAYTAWDLTGVQHCDIVLAYMEKDNPGGQNMALEMGVAVALGKHIIYVEEEGHPSAKYLGMARAVSDSFFRTLDQGIERLLRVTSLTMCTGEFRKSGVACLKF